MTGLELARDCFFACRPILAETIPDIMRQAASGLVGEGSECFGCDDETSRDHDFSAAFCLWLPEETLRDNFFRIKEAFDKLPRQFAGFPTRFAPRLNQGRRGPLAIEKFYAFFTGLGHPPASWREWLAIPEYQLAAATNGEVFEDGAGIFGNWRQALLAGYPRDVWLKKLATRAMLAAQSGQYNFPRTLRRGDKIAAMLAKARFAENALGLVYLLNGRYMPFYKWAPKLARGLPIFGQMTHETLDKLASLPDDEAIMEIEGFCAAIGIHLAQNGLSNTADAWLWAHGLDIAARIETPEIRKLNMLKENL